MRECPVLFSQIQVVSERVADRPCLSTQLPALNLHQPFRLVIRERAQQDAIYDTEDCGIRAKAQGKRQDDG
jgi:hypothetical protein